MSDIFLILLDLNGVLYRYDRDARIAYLASLAKRSPAAVKQAIWDSGFEDTGDAGVLDAAGYLEGFGERLGCHLAETEWVAAQRLAIEPIAASLHLVSRLRPPVRCAVLTNNNLLVRKHFAALYPEAAALAGDCMYVSAEFGARKPNPEVYRRCLARAGLPCAAALFVDDDPANVVGAREAGLSGYVYADPAALAAEFRRRSLLA